MKTSADETYVEQLVSWALELCLNQRSGIARDAMRRIAPYQVILRKDGRFLLLNRSYKPIGANRAIGHVDYDDPDFKLLSLSTLVIEPYGSMNGTKDYFFSDANPPWESKAFAEEYVARIEECLGISPPEDAPHFLRAAAKARYEKAFEHAMARAKI